MTVKEPWRVQDRRYKSGWRWTPHGRRVIRTAALLVVLWPVSFMAAAAYHAPLIPAGYGAALTTAGYIRFRKRRLLRSRVTASLPGPAGLGERRQRAVIPLSVKQAVYARDGGRCRHCGKTEHESRITSGEPLHYDHIVPFSANGADTVNNLQLLCGLCNRSKSNRFAG